MGLFGRNIKPKQTVPDMEDVFLYERWEDACESLNLYKRELERYGKPSDEIEEMVTNLTKRGHMYLPQGL